MLEDKIQSLSQEAHQLLARKKLKCAVAESLTGGRIQVALTSHQGASATFHGGIVAYDREAKVNLLKVDDTEARSCACVSDNIAIVMAENVCRMFKADISISTTGFANGGSKAIPQPHAYISVFVKNKAERRIPAELLLCESSNRNCVQDEVTERALELLIEEIKAWVPR